MPVYNVNVKWGRELFKNVEINTEETPMDFKLKLQQLTGIEPERQKVMVKGVTVKGTDWENIKLVNDCTVLLMGSKEDVPVLSTAAIEQEANELSIKSNEEVSYSSGLANLGNTCYMNATIQCLRTVTELKEALNNAQDDSSVTSSIIVALRDLFKSMERGKSFPPILLLNRLQVAVPRFAEKSPNGTYVQQDANECWLQFMQIMQSKLPPIHVEEYTTKCSNFVDQFFRGVLDIELKCVESNNEPVTNSQETFLQLSCFITQSVKHVVTGLKSKLMESIIKNSTILKKDVTFTRTSRISRLPSYLTVQFVRFFYKESKSINAKILKEIKFPINLDVFDLCSEDLKKRLLPMREKYKEFEDKQLKSEPPAEQSVISLMETDPTQKLQYSFQDDLGSNNSGYYTLQAVLTHQGRSSSSGHYVAWQRLNSNLWMKCDDNVVTPIPEEDILKLSGGGDWHCAYVLLYGPRIMT